MGCGSSSLKGADIPNVNSQPTTAPQPLRKVRTNFSDINYDQNAQQRRLTEYAPHEKPPPVAEESRDYAMEQSSNAYEQYQQNDPRPYRPDDNAGGWIGDPKDRTMSGSGPGDRNNDANNLKPYQSIDGGGDWDDQDNQDRHPLKPPPPPSSNVNGTQDGMDPTSDLSKNEFAADNDPANPNNQDGRYNNPQRQPGGGNSQADGYRNNEDDYGNNNNNNNDNDDNNDIDNANNTGPTGYNDNPDIQGDGNASEPKKSWLGEKYSSFQSARRGTGLSDEDLIKYTGKDRQELSDWAQNRPGVGPNQGAGRVGSDSGLAAGAPWT